MQQYWLPSSGKQFYKEADKFKNMYSNSRAEADLARSDTAWYNNGGKGGRGEKGGRGGQTSDGSDGAGPGGGRSTFAAKRRERSHEKSAAV